MSLNILIQLCNLKINLLKEFTILAKKKKHFKGPLTYLGHCIRIGYILNIFNTKEITFWPLESSTKDGIVYLIVHDSIKSFCHEFLYFLSIQNRFQTRQL